MITTKDRNTITAAALDSLAVQIIQRAVIFPGDAPATLIRKMASDPAKALRMAAEVTQRALIDEMRRQAAVLRGL